jgi:ribosome modulation factor
MSASESEQDIRNMTADAIGKDLLSALVTELKLLPRPFEQLSQKQQDEIIDRLRLRVRNGVGLAVHLIASGNRTVVVGDLEQITIKDGAKAVIKIPSSAENLHDLYDAQGSAVLVVVTDADQHTAGMDAIKGEADQRAMDLGHEYHDNDGGGMEDASDGEVIEGETLALPSPEEAPPSEDERSEAWEAGYKAAEEGKRKDDAPTIRHELVSEWLSGWNAYHEENAGAADDAGGNDES